MRQKQSEQIVEILRQKAEEERPTSTSRTRAHERKSDGRIAASAAAATAAVIVPTQSPKRMGMENDDIIGEVPPKVTNISLSFAGLPQEEIV